MEDHTAEFAEPFIREGYNLDEIVYVGESVLLREFRGKGTGHAFFDLREAQAKRLGRTYACFCAVIRPFDHPKRPADYSPLDTFWRKRGYRIMEGVTATYPWKDIGAAEETEKHMQFWLRDLCSEQFAAPKNS
jgi:GNAT superfamily N-acetyltransferase